MSGEEIENWITTKDEAEQGYDLEEGSSAFAFKLRVMLSHLRLKYAAFKKLRSEERSADPAELKELYQMFDDAAPEPRSREHPFFAFRFVFQEDAEATYFLKLFYAFVKFLKVFLKKS